MDTRKIIVQLTEFSPRANEIEFLPRLTGADGEVLLARSYVCTTDEEGAGEIELPVRSSGTIRYGWRIVNPAGGESKGTFELEAGGDIDLSDLIAGSPAATDSVRDYVDEKIAAAMPYKIYRAMLSQSGTDAPTLTELENTIGAITAARYGAGRYGLEISSGEFTAKTFARVGGGIVNADPQEMPARRMTAWRYNSGLVAILITDMSGNDADLNATAATVEILIY